MQRFPELSVSGIDLLNKLLTYDPSQRISARAALRHPFFSEHPLPKAQEFMPTFPSGAILCDGVWLGAQSPFGATPWRSLMIAGVVC